MANRHNDYPRTINEQEGLWEDDPEETSESATYGCVAAIFVLFLAFVVSPILNGWVISIFWGWFIIPTFMGTPTISIAQAIGIAMTVRIVTGPPIPSKENDEGTQKMVTKTIGISVAAPLLTMLVGWIVHLFV